MKNNNLLKSIKIDFLLIATCFFLISIIIPELSTAAEKSIGNEIITLTEKKLDSDVEVTIGGIHPIIATVYELPNPDRIIVDIAESTIPGEVKNQLANFKIVTVSADYITDAKPSITRLQIKPSYPFNFTHKNIGNNLILDIREINKTDSKIITNNTKPEVLPPPDLNTDSSDDTVGKLINKNKEIQNQLPVVNPLDKSISKSASVEQMQDSFNFSGYNKERITVEFQKMDLHNVFNFLRQVSGVNIVVDESVQGSLTLVLDDVPWDFALDIILNLKNLEKEDRFNTLVIYPKGKGFVWPKQADQNLSFEASAPIVEKEALSIKQLENQSLTITEAKQQMSLAREAEKREDYETAVKLYEQAFDKWSDNSKLANQISSIYLVHLRQNAKALNYANKSITIDPKNSSSYLNAGIASANMQNFEKAKNFFEKSITNTKPSKEALLSYAAFNENRYEYDSALLLLDKYETLYGNDLNSMVSSARIHDKMGKSAAATDKYKTILHAGFRIPQDLDTYIKQRISSSN